MRVLMICPQFHPLVGGYERAAERLSAELVRSDCEVTVVTDGRDPRWPSREVMEGYEIRRLYTRFRRGWHIPTSLLSHVLWLLCHGRRFDVWHVHQYGLHATMAVLIGRLLQRPVILKLTSTVHQGLQSTLTQVRFARLQRWAHCRVDACLAVSDEAAIEASAFGIRRNGFIASAMG